jgi:hypothetical protein
MGAIDNINSGEMRKFISRVERLERAAPTGFSSITRGQFRVGGSAQILVDSSGGMSINGSFVGAGRGTLPARAGSPARCRARATGRGAGT